MSGNEHDYRHWRGLLDVLIEGAYVVDKHRKILYWNKASEKITGYSKDEILGKSCMDNILMHVDEAGNSLCKGDCPLAKTLRDGKVREANVYLHHKDGYRKPVYIRAIPLKDGNDEIYAALEVFDDRTPEEAFRQRMAELEKLAMFDELTRLPNRRYIEERLEAFMGDFDRHGLKFGVIFMDIDHFKIFNDVYGHDVGDRVLKVVANTLLSASRVSDVVGRWGGEEFVALIKNVEMDTLEIVADRYRLLVENSDFELNGKSLNVTISAGATIAKQGDTKESIIKRADELMYISKQRGRNRLTIG